MNLTDEEIDAMTVRRAPAKTLEPLDDTVVFRAELADRTAAGLVIPEKGATAEARKKGIVVAVGPGRLLEDGVSRAAMSVRVGDWLILHATAPTPGMVTVTGEELYLCRDADVAARVVAVGADEAS